MVEWRKEFSAATVMKHLTVLKKMVSLPKKSVMQDSVPQASKIWCSCIKEDCLEYNLEYDKQQP